LSAWVLAVAETELSQKKSLNVQINGKDIGLFAVDHQYHAMENACPHAAAYSLLTEGHICGERVECPYHNAQFHIPTGKCLRKPGRDLMTYDLKIENGYLYISL